MHPRDLIELEQENQELRNQVLRLSKTAETVSLSSCYDAARTIVEGEFTDVTLCESKNSPNVGLYGACEELLFYFGPEDADFFQAIANELRRRLELQELKGLKSCTQET